MSAVAALLSLALFILFAGSAIQKFRFTPMTASTADHLDVSKNFLQRVGGVELLGALGLVAGLSATTGVWAIVNEAAAGGLVLLTIGAVVFHRRAGDSFKASLPALVAGLACAVELALRLNA